MHVLFEGSERAVDAQLHALGGEECDPWAELRVLQAIASRPRALGRRARAARAPRSAGRLRRRRRGTPRGAHWPSACGRPCAARADRRLRPLRLLPAGVPDVLALARGDGLAARADPSDAGARRRDDRAHRHGRRALRPLPRLHGLRARVPVGRQVRPADRADAATTSRSTIGASRSSGSCAPGSSRSCRTAAACGRRSLFRKLPAPGPFAPLKQIAPPWAARSGRPSTCPATARRSRSWRAASRASSSVT